jgi:hypothetical protein
MVTESKRVDACVQGIRRYQAGRCKKGLLGGAITFLDIYKAVQHDISMLQSRKVTQLSECAFSATEIGSQYIFGTRCRDCDGYEAVCNYQN